MTATDNTLIRQGLLALGQHLPSGWRVARTTVSGRNEAEALVRITAPDGKAGLLSIETKRRLEPRGAVELAAKLKSLPLKGTPLVMALYLSPAVRQRLQDADIAFLDLAGNIRLELPKPGLFISAQGADKNPSRKERPSRSLRGAKAGRIVRVLIDSKQLPRIRELAKLADVDPGYVSRVLSLLDTEALIERSSRGSIVRVDWPRLLKRWAQDSPLTARGTQTTCLAPHGLENLQSQLKRLNMRYAITGSLVAAKVAPIAAPRLLTLYAEDPQRAMSDLGLRTAEAGANVLLIEPTDVGIFADVAKQDGLWFAPLSQVAADLLTSPGRGPAEAEELISWMSNHEEQWRG